MATLRLGDDAPDFTAETTEGELTFHDWKGDGWAVLFSHPADFTPVCTTELGRVAQLKDEWAARNTKVLAVSVDALEDHTAWKADIEERLRCRRRLPDRRRQGPPGRRALRHDPPGRRRHLHRPLGLPHRPGRQGAPVADLPQERRPQLRRDPARAGCACRSTTPARSRRPADWKAGERIIVAPTVTTEDAQARFKGVEVVKPYLRYAEAPSA